MIIQSDIGSIKGDGYSGIFTAEFGKDFSLFVDKISYSADLMLEVSIDGDKWYPYNLAFTIKDEGCYGLELPLCTNMRFKIKNDNRGVISMKLLQHR